MDKRETVQLFSLISNVYDHFEVTEEKVALWHDLLRDQDARKVYEKAREHFNKEKFPPTVAQLREQNELYANHGSRNKNVIALLEAHEEGATKEVPREIMPDFIKKRGNY